MSTGRSSVLTAASFSYTNRWAGLALSSGIFVEFEFRPNFRGFGCDLFGVACQCQAYSLVQCVLLSSSEQVSACRTGKVDGDSSSGSRRRMRRLGRRARRHHRSLRLGKSDPAPRAGPRSRPLPGRVRPPSKSRSSSGIAGPEPGTQGLAGSDRPLRDSD